MSKLVETPNKELILAGKVKVGPTSGARTIASMSGKFQVDPDFKKVNAPGPARSARMIYIHDIHMDGTFSQIVNSLARPPRLRLTQDQIVEIALQHWYWLPSEKHRTMLFLFEENKKLYIATARRYSDGRHPSIDFGLHHYENECVLRRPDPQTTHSIAVPKLRP